VTIEAAATYLVDGGRDGGEGEQGLELLPGEVADADGLGLWHSSMASHTPRASNGSKSSSTKGAEYLPAFMVTGQWTRYRSTCSIWRLLQQ
jgi:hypothetical protein